MIRKARKQHQCDMCFKPINIKTDYWHETITPWDNIDSDGFYEHKAHKECHDVWENGLGKYCYWNYEHGQDMYEEWVSDQKYKLEENKG